MPHETQNPGAFGDATGAEYEAGQPVTKEYLIRKDWANAVWFALDHCDPEDAAHICATCLADLETGGPTLGDIFGTVMGDAVFWADVAPAHELAAYGLAALDRLRGTALGIGTRKRLFARLWETFDPKDRQAFLRRVDAEGKFRGAA
ncbi:hypothetical protein [Paenirhodobacter enshiensis]|uniref:hypothetical protein n=1 Tax=Paenirhodobacter enshiensis TaxID=1105367 RepID=UPI0035ADB9A9